MQEMDNALRQLLRQAARRWQRQVAWTGAIRTLLVAMLVLLTACCLDLFLPLPWTGRVLLSFTFYGIVLVYALTAWLGPTLIPIKPKRLAWLLEHLHPQLNEKLISAVELQREKGSVASGDLIRELVRQTAEDMERLHIETSWPLSWKLFVAPVLLLLLFAAALLTPGLPLVGLVKRVVLPSTNDATVGSLRLIVREPGGITFLEREPIRFVVTADGPERDVELVMEGRRQRVLPMTYDAVGQRYVLELDGLRTSLRYFARCGKVISRAYDLRMIRRPVVESFKLAYTFPGYSGLEPFTVDTDTGAIKALEGTRVDLYLQVSKPLRELSLIYLGHSTLAFLSEDKRQALVSITVGKSGVYTLALKDEDGYAPRTVQEYEVAAIEDTPPQVVVIEPEADALRQPDEPLELRWQTRDDFGVTNQVLTWSLNNGPQRTLRLEPYSESHVLDLPSMKLMAGDLLSVRIAADDARGQRSASERREIMIARAAQWARAKVFLDALDQMVSQLQQSQQHLRGVTAMRGKMAYGAQEPGAAQTRDLMQAHVAQLNQALRQAEQAAARARSNAFFLKAGSCIHLAQRFIRQERLFTLPAAAFVDEQEKPIERLETMIRLARLMGDLLKTKGRQQQDVQQWQALLRTAGYTCFRNDATARGLNKRLLNVARTIAADKPLAESFATLSFEKDSAQKNVFGLLGHYYKNLNELPLDNVIAKRTADSIRLQAGFDIPMLHRLGMGNEDVVAVSWTGWLRVPQPGKYGIWITSDDGSRLNVSGQSLIDNNGHHAMQERGTHRELDAGIYPVTLYYFNSGGPGGLKWEWLPPRGKREIVPSRMLLPKPVRTEDRLLIALQQTVATLKKPAADYKQIDTCAEEITRWLFREASAMHRLAADLEMHNKEKDRQRARQMARDFEQQAREQAKAARTVPGANDRADTLRQMSEALDEAISQAQTEKVHHVADALDALRRNEALEETRNAIREQARDLGDDVQRAMARAQTAEQEHQTALMADAMAAVHESEQALERLREQVNRHEAIDKKQAHALENALKQAADGLRQTQEMLHQDNAGKAAEMVGQTADMLENADKQIAEWAGVAGADMQQAHDTIKHNRTPVSDQLAASADALKQWAEQAQQAEDADAVEVLSDRLTANQEQVRDLANRMKVEAEQALTRNPGALNAEPAARMVLANVAAQLAEQELQQARRHWESAAKQAADREAPQKTAQQNAAQQAAENARAGAEKLEQVSDLLRRQEEAALGALTAHEEEQLVQDLRAMAEETLGAEAGEMLEQLAALEEARKQIDRMAEDSRALEKRYDHNRSRELADESELVRHDLAHKANELDPEAAARAVRERTRQLLDKTDELIDQARQQRRDLRQATQKLTQSDVDKHAHDTRAAVLDEAMKDLEKQLAAVMPEHAGKNMEAVRRKLGEARKSDIPADRRNQLMGEAVEQLKDVRHAVEQAMRKPPPQAPSTPMVKNADQKPLNVADMQRSLDELKHDFSRYKAAGKGLRQVEKALTPVTMKGLDLLEQVEPPADNKPMQDKLDKFKRGFAIESPARQAEWLRNAAQDIRQSQPELHEQMNQQADELNKTFHTLPDLRGLEQLRQNYGRQIPQRSEQLDQKLRARSEAGARKARDRLDALARNMDVGDDEAAARNLDALQRDLIDMAAEEGRRRAQSMENKPSWWDRPAPRNDRQVEPQAAKQQATMADKPTPDQERADQATKLMNENHNRFAQQAAMESATAPNDAKPALQAAEKGDYERAAALSEGVPRSLFEKAAELDQAMREDQAPTPHIFRVPREKQGATVPPNRPALDGLAAADALDNREAAQHGCEGRYEQAADSMQRLAEALPSGPRQKQAQQAVRRFKAAAEAQREIAQKPRDANRASLPEPLELHAQGLERMAQSAAPLPAAYLDRAAKAVRDRDYRQAADEMRKAAVALPHAQRQELAQAADQLERHDRETYADAEPRVREAIKQMKDPQSKAAEAARQGALTEAARLARAQGKQQAADTLEQATGDQADQTSPELRKALEAARHRVPQHEKELRGELQRKASQGDPDLALRTVEALEQAADRRREEARIADMLKRAEAYTQLHQEPLRQAIEAARQSRFGEAAAQAARSRFGQQSAEELARAEQQMDQAMRQSADTFAPMPYNQKERSPMERTFNAIRSDNLLQAQREIEHAGKTGKPTKENLDEAHQAVNQAVKDLEHAYKKVREENPFAQHAQQELQALKDLLKQDAQEAEERHKLAAREHKALREAVNTVHRCDDQRLKDRIDGLRGPWARKQGENETKSTPTKSVKEALQNLQAHQQKGAAELRKAAQQAAANDDQRATQALNQAAEAAEQGQIPRARQLAGQAGEHGKAPRDALQAADGAREQMKQAIEQTRRAAEQAERQAAQDKADAQRRLQRLQSLPNLLKQKNYQQAAHMAGQAAEGAFEAMKTAEALEQAAASATPPVTSTGSAQTHADRAAAVEPVQVGRANQAGRSTPTAAQPGQDAPVMTLEKLAAESLAQATHDMQAAENQLQTGSASSKSSAAMQTASEHVRQAMQQLAQQMAHQLAQTSGSRPPGAPSAGPRQASHNQQTGDPGNQQGQGSENQAQNKIDPLTDRQIADPWKGVEGNLDARDSQARATRYSPYYRRAIKQYLQHVAKERAQWNDREE